MRTPVVTSFGHVVEATKTALSLSTLHYEHGRPLEIINTLSNMSKTQSNMAIKYPLIALFQDFQEEQPRKAGDPIKARVQVVIATQGKTDMKAAARYNATFTNVLIPIYEELVRQIQKSAYFFNATVPHTRIDHPYWGKEGLYGNTGNIFDDALDCIELRGLELIVPSVSCQPYALKNF